MKRLQEIAVALVAIGLAAQNARAVILFRTGDPAANSTAPDGPLAGSGWQYEGQWGSYLGTPIAPQFFISAAHVGGSGTFVFGGTSYFTAGSFKDPFSDLLIWQLPAGQTFPSFAPLYRNADPVGAPLVAIGRGTQRGEAINLNGTDRGWQWGQGDGVQRWGQNSIAAAVHDSEYGDLIFATFDNNGAPNECHLSSGDSGGAIFLQQDGVWKLAGINLAVDDVYTAPFDAARLSAALYDSRDYYEKIGAGSFALITGSAAVPTGFYASSIAARSEWIASVIDPSGDADGNGLPNLLEYARALNAPVNQSYRTPAIVVTNGTVTMTYRKLTNVALRYEVQQSSDLQNWTTASANESVVSTNENVQTIAAAVARPASGSLFLRVRITQ